MDSNWDFFANRRKCEEPSQVDRQYYNQGGNYYGNNYYSGYNNYNSGGNYYNGYGYNGYNNNFRGESYEISFPTKGPPKSSLKSPFHLNFCGILSCIFGFFPV